MTTHNDHPSYVKHVLGSFYLFCTGVGCVWGGGGVSFKRLVHNLPMLFFGLGISKIKDSDSYFFHSVSTHNDHPSYVKHVVGGIGVFFRCALLGIASLRGGLAEGNRGEDGARGGVRVPERGKLGMCDIWKSEIWCGENSAPLLKYHCKTWYKFPDCSTRTSMLFPVGLWSQNRAAAAVLPPRRTALQLAGRTIRVDHVKDYKHKEQEDQLGNRRETLKDRLEEEAKVCGPVSGQWRSRVFASARMQRWTCWGVFGLASQSVTHHPLPPLHSGLAGRPVLSVADTLPQARGGGGGYEQFQ